MATFEKLIYDIPPFQEGNLADFEFEMDTAFPIEMVSDITFQVRTLKGGLVMEKTKSGEQITLTNRLIRIPIEPEDTLGFGGSHIYEIDFKNNDDKPFATIGGAFVINKQINTL